MNGAIETVFRELRDTMALLLHDSGRDPSFWALAAKHAEYLINIRPKEHLNGYCAYELLTGIKPHDIRDLHPFGADAFAFDPLRRGGKLGPKARHGIYVGFSPTSLSHKVYCPDTNTIIETIHVKVVPRARAPTSPPPTTTTSCLLPSRKPCTVLMLTAGPVPLRRRLIPFTSTTSSKD
ncbi:uncharacterized protein MONBRDRAFT_29359 [Monosiga brevicollis MX1]|uniref:Retroviral polymerase SH3-like domain-containing protein n=1 Tax=Monosiga brevicollis TaxID=81824 RepID=A9VAV6_MONBE|nr:uncharacterized protein MONBRDRAFT_29359 [Monosiga brevicollis MX1]EDQ85442.1 predicted protein [Monosiga brevicollis MX1]|eukprot:XP_001749853.1 hypothetical protein [Monosiga brevicollis MX1]